MYKAIFKNSFLFFILNVSLTLGQQDPQITQNMFDKFLYNPGVVGSQPSVNVGLLHRSQWVGVPGAPTTQNLTVESRIEALNGGIGLNVINDALGPLSTKTATLSYAYQLRLNENNQLGFGLSFGMMQIGFDEEWITPDGQIDSSLPPTGTSATVPDIGLGLYFTSENYYLGLSITHLVPFEANFDGVATFNPARHYYVAAGYDYDIDEQFSVRPSYYMKTDGVIFQMDFNVNAFYQQKHWVGFSYRIEDAIAFLVGAELTNNLTLGYAYDFVTSKLASETTGGHEVMLRYSFDLDIIGKPDTRYKNVRFL
jgi:type IX secretion system PorP/SprF family membrane protein